MAKQTKATLFQYLNCPELAVKWQNILDSFHHLDGGEILMSHTIAADKITLNFSGGKTIEIPIGGGSQFTPDMISRILAFFYQPATQTISVAPTSFEKGVATNLVFTWNVIKKDDTLTSATLDGNNVTANVDGTAKAYNVNGVTASKTVALNTVLDRSGNVVNLNNSATSNALLYAFWGVFNNGASPTTSATIRVLSKQFLNTVHKGIITTNVQSGSGLKEISFYVKKGNNYKVTDLGNLGLVITNDFAKTDVTVKDGGGVDEQYEKVTKTLGADFGLVNFKFEII